MKLKERLAQECVEARLSLAHGGVSFQSLECEVRAAYLAGFEARGRVDTEICEETSYRDPAAMRIRALDEQEEA